MNSLKRHLRTRSIRYRNCNACIDQSFPLGWNDRLLGTVEIVASGESRSTSWGLGSLCQLLDQKRRHWLGERGDGSAIGCSHDGGNRRKRGLGTIFLCSDGLLGPLWKGRGRQRRGFMGNRDARRGSRFGGWSRLLLRHDGGKNCQWRYTVRKTQSESRLKMLKDVVRCTVCLTVSNRPFFFYLKYQHLRRRVFRRVQLGPRRFLIRTQRFRLLLDSVKTVFGDVCSVCSVWPVSSVPYTVGQPSSIATKRTYSFYRIIE